MIGTNIRLIEDIPSGKKDVNYGLKGQTVEIISQRDHLFIVQDKSGNRFPVQITKTDYKP